MDMIYAHGCTWRYELNAIKSFLVLGESKTEHMCDAKDRIFKPGPSRVKERTSYEHVGCNQAGYSGARVRLNISVYCLGFASQYRALWLPSATN